MDLERALAVIGAGEIVGVPTDTVYGIGVDPHSRSAADKLFAIKGRGMGKPVGLLVASLAQAQQLVALPDYATAWAEQYWPGPLNLIALPLVKLAIGTRDSLAVRVPAHETALELLQVFGPLAVTSANLSSGPETHSDAEAAVLGDNVAYYVPGTCPGEQASTTIDVRGPEPRLMRAGPITLEF
jgi:tRNA threonylcarbamoyl adenosine modification protein (Sua5/YciO/YrdC/YwlC family)